MIYIHMHTHQEAGLTQVLGVVGFQMVARCAKRMSRQSILSSLVDPYSNEQSAAAAMLCQEEG